MYTMAIVGHQVLVLCDKEGVARVMRDAPKCLTNNFNTRMLEAVGGVTSSTITHSLFGKLTGVVIRSFSSRAVFKLAPGYTQRIIEEIMLFADGRPVPISEFVGESLYRAVSFTLWGPQYPLDTYAKFKYIDSQIPRLLSSILFPPRRATQARDSLKCMLGEFLKEHWDEVHGIAGAASAGNDVVRTLRQASLSPSDERGVLLSFLLGLHANSLRVTTWFLAFLLSHPIAVRSIQEEIDHAIKTEFGSLSILLSSPVESFGTGTFPLLNSALQETMRLIVPPVFMRQVKADTDFPLNDATTIGLKQGQYVVADGCNLNMAHNVFEEPSKFKYDRFTQFEGENGKSTPLLVSPFGGGVHACKGQDFAMYEMKVFVIVCLRLFDITAETSTGACVQQSNLKPTTSIPTPVMYLEDGVFVRVRKRPTLA